MNNLSLQAKIALLDNIPDELKTLNQWVCWAYEDVGAEKPTKVPYNPRGYHASVTKPATWSSFKDCVEIYASGKYDGIGFVFTANDPYCFLDLDNPRGNNIILDRQINIAREFDSYSEVSPSGEGLHIIIKGSVSVGRKRSSIEIYSSERYATFTGNVHNNKPIGEYQQMLTVLWEQMGESSPQHIHFTGDKDEKETDQEIIQKASNARNGDKFTQLNAGEWQAVYSSQSEADFAFIDIIAFYTQNRNQITRIFRQSKLGLRDKSKRDDYVNGMISRSFDRMPPKIDFEGFKIEIDKQLRKDGDAFEPAQAGNQYKRSDTSPQGLNNSLGGDIPVAQRIEHKPSKLEVAGSNPVRDTSLKLPPGLLGEVAQFIYQSSPRPVPEIALAGAIGLLAGISGRAYNVSATGLNQYVLLLANTGAGKEAIASGISKLMSVVKQQVPTAPYFIGPSEIASGQALFKYISSSSQCFVSVLGEFGLRMLQMANQNANSAEVSLRRIILDLYNKSGFKDVLQPSIYADKDKNVALVQSPAFSICGESTPERFYSNLNEDMISEGLLPRFLLIEYSGPRVPFNEQHSFAVPSFQLIDKLTTLAANAETIQHANPRRVVDVRFTDEANKLSKEFDIHCDGKINNSEKDVVKQLWNRGHIKVLKLAALVAVGVNMFDPIIEVEYLHWAIDMINADIETLTLKFEEGKVGANTVEIRQIDETIRMIKDYIYKDWDYVQRYSDKNEKSKILHTNRILSYTYLSRRLIANSAFKNDKIGATNSIKRCLQVMCDRDTLKEMNRSDMISKFGSTAKAYVISDPNILKA